MSSHTLDSLGGKKVNGLLGIGLLLLPFIFFPILGFGSAQYQGPAASPGVAVSLPPQPA
jgi:hypothetical protein